MNVLSNFSVRRPVTLTMMILVGVLIGILSLSNLSIELFPSMDLPFTMVMTQYPNATPEEVEQMVTNLLEGSLSTVENVKEINSISSENSSMIMVEFAEGTNMDTAMLEIREYLGIVTPMLPDGVLTPTIMKMTPDMMPIMSFAIGIDNKNRIETTTYVQDEILPLIERVPGVGEATLTGAAQSELTITLDDEKILSLNEQLNAQILDEMMSNLVANGVPESIAKQTTLPDEAKMNLDFSAEMIGGIIQAQNFSMPAGYVTDDNTQYVLRVGDKLESMQEVKDLTIMQNGDLKVQLSDIANIEMVDTSSRSYTKVNGQDAVMIQIQKQSDAAITDVTKRVNEALQQIEEDYDNISVNMLMNQGDYVELAVNSVASNLLIGGVLAVVILFIFLRAFGPTFIIALSIPISVVVTFILIYFSNITLNMVSLGGLALGVGMLVDNSIVVIENIYRLRSQGVSKKEAAITGANQVAGAITASTLTTIAVFLPILFVEGMTADIFRELALTIAFSLLASLLIALTLVPMLSSKYINDIKRKEETTVMYKVKKAYARSLNTVLKHHFITMILPLVLLVGSVFLGLTKGFEFFPAGDEGQIMISATLPEGLSEDEQFEALDNLLAKYEQIDEIQTLGATLGGSMMGPPSNRGGVSMYILLKADIDRTTSEVANELRELSEDYAGELTINEQMTSMMSMGSGISITVTGADFNLLEQTATEVAKLISTVDGTTEVDNGVEKTAPEFKITVDRDKSIEAGLSTAQIFTQVREIISPNTASSSVTLSGYSFPLNVQETEEGSSFSLEDIQKFELTTTFEDTVLLEDVATVSLENSYASINHENQSRKLTVTATLKEGYNIGLVGQEIEVKLADYDAPEGYQVVVGGEQEQINEAIGQLTFALIAAILLVYMVMAAQFESYKFPFIILMTVPLAITGGFFALFITNNPISVISMIGLVVLTGVVVNNGIVIVDYINQLRQENMGLTEAILQGGQDRLRPIIMTALTTIIALVPMALGIGDGAEMMAPMAITTIGGLIYATLLTLFVVPAIYYTFEYRREAKIDKS